jgi:hypothetical protein
MVSNILLGLLAASIPFASAGNLYLYPPRSYVAAVNSLEDASAAISRHIGLDMFEHVNHETNALLVEEEFVGKGMDSSVLLTMNEADARGMF